MAAIPFLVTAVVACRPGVSIAETGDTREAAGVLVPPAGHWRWQTLETVGKPTGRHETSLVEYAGKFYMIGGRESRQVDRFDPQDGDVDQDGCGHTADPPLSAGRVE